MLNLQKNCKRAKNKVNCRQEIVNVCPCLMLNLSCKKYKANSQKLILQPSSEFISFLKITICGVILYFSAKCIFCVIIEKHVFGVPGFYEV